MTANFTSLSRWARATVCVLGLASIPALAPAQSASDKLDHVTLQLKWTHQFQFAGYYAAIAQGYYRDAGLDVKLVEATPDMADPADEVLRGKADFGVGNSSLMLLRAQGKPVVVLGVIYQHSPLLLVARHDATVGDIHDLVGKPIMIEPEAADIYAYFKNEGVDPSKLTIVPHTFDINDLIQGKVAAMSAYQTDEAFRLRAAGFDFLEFTPRAGGVDFYGDNLFTTENEIKYYPDRVRAFRAASLRGWNYALAHQDEIIDLIESKYNRGRSREQLAFEADETRRLMHPDLIEVGYMNPGRWQHIADTYADLGMISKATFPWRGFLYDPNPKPNLKLLYGLLFGLAVLVLAALLWIFPLVYLNRKLRHEIGRRTLVERQLRRSEKQYRELVESAPFPVLITDLANSRVLYANPRKVAMLGAGSGGSADGISTHFYADPEQRNILFEELRRGRIVADREMGLKTIDGRSLWALLSAGTIEFDGQSAILISFNDITPRRAMEDALLKAKEEAEEADATKSHYLAVMSHEIRSPISGIAHLLSLILEERPELSEPLRNDLQMLEHSARSLFQMVDELLEWSRAEAGRVDIETTEIRLEPFLDDLRKLFLPMAETKKLAFRCVVEEGVPPVILSDPFRLRQILSNLLANALKFTSQGEVAMTVRRAPGFGTETDDGCRLRFQVTDSGIGIPPEAVGGLFEPYRQADPSIARQFGGSGLGLSISLHLAQLLGGGITVASEPGQGTTFTVEIVAKVPSGVAA